MFDEATEFAIVVSPLPAIGKPANNLKISGFIVAVTVDPIERTEKLFVPVLFVHLEGKIRKCTKPLLKFEKGYDVLLEFRFR